MKEIFKNKYTLPAGFATLVVLGAVVSNWSQLASVIIVFGGFAALVAGKKFLG